MLTRRRQEQVFEGPNMRLLDLTNMSPCEHPWDSEMYGMSHFRRSGIVFSESFGSINVYHLVALRHGYCLAAQN